MLTLAAAVMLGQCSTVNGRYVCTEPTRLTTYYVEAPIVQAAPMIKSWHSAKMPDGSDRWVWGWREGRNVAYVRSEQPPAPPAYLGSPSQVEPRRPFKLDPKPPPIVEKPPTAEIEPVHPVVGQLPSFAVRGVDRDKLALNEGYQTAHHEGHIFLESIGKPQSGGVPDDSRKPHLTVIGSEAETKPIEDAIRGKGPLGKIASEIHFQAYTPDSEYVKGLGFQAGKPAVYFQLPGKTGRVVHRQLDYTGGELALASAIEKTGALRKPDPNYDPKKDTDQRISNPLADIPLDLETGAVGLALVLIVLAVRKSRKGA
jgi:hypothetical protein